jgi:SAM-dependent methyltransferase
VSERHLFGDTEIAAARLDVVAEVFADTSRAFLRESVPPEPGLAVDLGCGPGHTTRLLAQTVRPRRTVGLELSEAFVARARRDAPDGVEFVRHDVTSVPFPTGSADLIYGRFLLSHFREPSTLVAAWGTQLASGGLLLTDEVEWIRTEHRAFSTYLEILDGLVRSRGAVLNAGPIVEAIADSDGLRRRSSRLSRSRRPSSRPPACSSSTCARGATSDSSARPAPNRCWTSSTSISNRCSP